jgi:hypothetical protein
MCKKYEDIKIREFILAAGVKKINDLILKAIDLIDLEPEKEEELLMEIGKLSIKKQRLIDENKVIGLGEDKNVD